jgi:hypothetical protein
MTIMICYYCATTAQRYAMKLELLTNTMVVNDAIRFIASHAAISTTEKTG